MQRYKKSLHVKGQARPAAASVVAAFRFGNTPTTFNHQPMLSLLLKIGTLPRWQYCSLVSSVNELLTMLYSHHNTVQ